MGKVANRQCGSHVLKAPALGARPWASGAAILFRLFPLAAAAAAEQEGECALEFMHVEIKRDMKLMGCRSIAQISRANFRFR